MPWKVRKRACKQKSTGAEGTHAVVKLKRGGGEEQESCHLSEPKARAAIRARYANESALRALVRRVLTEGEDDVVELGLRIKLRDDARLADIYTDIRGLKNVITVKQQGEQDDIPGPLRYVNVFVTFEDDADRDVYNLKRDIRAIPGVEAVVLKNYEGRRWVEVEKTYTGGAASKEQK